MKETLKLFTKSDLRKASLCLLDQLEMRYTLGAGKPLQTKDLFAGKSLSKAAKEALDIVMATWFVALIDERTFDGYRDNLEFRTAIEGAKDEKYKGMFIFAIEVMPDAKLSRTVAANITRAFNKLAVDKPVVVMIRQAERLSIATCERGSYARSGNIGEKLGKVSVLHNINCANAHRGHCDLLRRMEGNRATNFDSLYKKWLEVFDVKLLSKRFYDELFEWYQWAMSLVGSGQMRFPAWPKDGHGKESRDETVIRIITRMLFIWFIKEKGLIPATLFNKRELKRIVKDFNPQNASAHNYYNAILQNLFFATLNCEKPDRKFIPESFHGRNEGYGVNSLYRGDDLLNIGKEEFMTLFKDIPYLNGGLFERLDSGQNYYDGFSKEARRRAMVPDMLFFREDVNDGHCGLITLFEKYVFTVEENTPIEQDISLDPELLGRVFENLLGAYNPETQETARKATGSYYTPREIVEYMVNESLVQHLIKTGIDEKQIRDLLEYHDGTQTELTDEQRKQVMTSLYHVKILDPACGSGAFPMGMLQQMVHVLRQIDPDNAHWEAFIKTTAGAQAEQAYTKTNDTETRKLQLDEIENAFNLRLANPDYARKLFIIQNCIYGVDIQPIAMQISKLRFFISLISEQNNDSILPLPNLETKFVCANTLIGVDRSGGSFSSDELEQKKDELIDVRKRLFYARTAKTKKKYREEDDKIRKELEKMIADMAGLGTSVAQQLVSWNPYDQNASSPFFDAEWMFGVKDGFDVVIGNPPYIDYRKIPTVTKAGLPMFESYRIVKTGSLYVYFIELGLGLLKKDGILVFINPYQYINADSGLGIRTHIINNHRLCKLVDVSHLKVFDNADTYTCINVFYSQQKQSNIDIFSPTDVFNLEGRRKEVHKSNILSSNGYKIFLSQNPIIDKVSSKGKELSTYTDVLCGLSASGFRDYVSDIKYDNNYLLFTESKQIASYITTTRNKYIHKSIYSSKPLVAFKQECIFIARMTSHMRAALSRKDEAAGKVNVLYNIRQVNRYYLLGLLNSKLLDYYYCIKNEAKHLNGGAFGFDTPSIKELPIAVCDKYERPIIALVDKILAAKKANPQADTSSWEREIDGLVYELYGLTEDEVKVVEGGE